MVAKPHIRYYRGSVQFTGHGNSGSMNVGDLPLKYQKKVLFALEQAYYLGAQKKVEDLKEMLDIPTHVNDLEGD